MNWLDLFGSASYELPLEVTPGSRFEGGPGYPDARVLSSEVLYPRRLLIQRMDLTVTDGAEKNQRIRVHRVAVETEDGELVEIRRLASPLEGEVSIDVTRCVACGGTIPEGQHVVIGDGAYHTRCVEDDDATQIIRNAVPARDDDPTRDSVRGHVPTKAKKDATTSTPRNKTVTEVEFEGKKFLPAYMVSITRIEGCEIDVVRLWSTQVSGGSNGRWSDGLYPLTIPRKTDVRYVAGRFFPREDPVAITAPMCIIWNRLYVRALAKLDQEWADDLQG